MTEKTYMTLKEAAEKSGYSADYIGQLIRNGKLEGKQMYSGVAWVTTETALNKYLKDSRGNKKSGFGGLVGDTGKAGTQTITARLFRVALYLAIFFGTVLVLILFYILASKLERVLEQRSIQQIESIHS